MVIVVPARLVWEKKSEVVLGRVLVVYDIARVVFIYSQQYMTGSMTPHSIKVACRMFTKVLL